MCSNKGTKTIDDDLIEGLHKAGCISDQNYNDDRRFVKVGKTINKVNNKIEWMESRRQNG